MKKTYQKPNIKVVRIDAGQNLLAASNMLENDKLEINSKTMKEGNGTDAAAKSFNVWGDDDEE